MGQGTEVVGDGGSHDGLVVDGVSLNSASSEGVAYLVGHGGVESKDQVSVLEDLSGSACEVSGHLGEGIVDQEKLSSVNAVLSAHAINKGGLVSTPGVLSILVDLSEEFGGVGVVETIPGVVIGEHVSHLSLVE